MAATSVVAIATRAELCVGACYSSVGPSGQCTFSVVNTTTGGIASLLWPSRVSLMTVLSVLGWDSNGCLEDAIADGRDARRGSVSALLRVIVHSPSTGCWSGL